MVNIAQQFALMSDVWVKVMPDQNTKKPNNEECTLRSQYIKTIDVMLDWHTGAFHKKCEHIYLLRNITSLYTDTIHK